MLTRSEVLDVRALVTVAEITTTARGIGAEVVVDHDEVGLDAPSVVNCDGLHTISQATLTQRVGEVDETTMRRVGTAVRFALDC